jgi:hypothetical protein
MDKRILAALLAIGLSACSAGPTVAQASGTLAPCEAYAPPPRDVDPTVSHLKTSATVIAVTSACTVRVRISGGGGMLATLSNRDIVLRGTTITTYAGASQGDLGAIGRFGLKAGETFTLSFDGRPFSDGSYPLNFMNR